MVRLMKREIEKRGREKAIEKMREGESKRMRLMKRETQKKMMEGERRLEVRESERKREREKYRRGGWDEGRKLERR